MGVWFCIGAGSKPRVAAYGWQHIFLPNKKCRVLPFTLGQHIPLPQNKVNTSLLGTPSGLTLANLAKFC